MCPDRQILSVYLDGELPSPWKEKMESHLLSCPHCRKVVDSWKQISGGLAEGETGSKDRVWEHISRRIKDFEEAKGAPAENGGFSVTAGRRTFADLWRRRVILPFPAAAALGAAAAALAVITSSLLLRPAEQNSPMIADSALSALENAGIDMELNNIRPISDVSGVLQYLERTDSNDIVIIRLPESRNFQSAGEPKMIRAADYSPRRPGP
jgi:anti-sigma factor RsiW